MLLSQPPFATYMQRMRKHLLVIGLLAFSIIFFNSLPGDNFALSALQDSGHAVVFALFTWLLLHVVKAYEDQSRFKTNLQICLVSLSIGICIELIQPFLGRDSSVLDALYDLIGCTAAGMFYHARNSSSDTTKKRLQYSASFLLLSAATLPLSKVAVLLQQQLAVPTLSSFENSWEHSIRKVGLGTTLIIDVSPEQWKANNSQVAKIVFGNARYPGVSFPHIYGDWSDYGYLQFDIYSEQPEPLQIILRIHDALHNGEYGDRYNRRLLIQPGLNHVNIDLNSVKAAPAARALQMDQIASMTLFMISPNTPAEIYLDDIRLSD